MIDMRRQHRRSPRRRGAALVEFAICVPILIVILFAIIEFSRAMQLQQSVRQAAFEGARVGVTLDATTTTVQTAATNNATMVGITNPTVTITPNPLLYTSPTITVTVSASPVTNTWFLKYFAGSSPISATITLDREVQWVSNP
jgi:Flp pilus assembly protein TadG